MKVSTLTAAAAAATVASAQGHNHGHQHAHQVKRGVVTTVTQNVAGPTAYAYVLDGKVISENQMCSGLKNNELKFADGQTPAGICSSSTTTTTTTAPSTTTTTSTTVVTTTTTKAATITTTTPPPPATTTTTNSPAPASSSAAGFYQTGGNGSGGGSSGGSGATGLTAEFPDGTLDCSHFPSDYGAVPLNYLGTGGWSGLQALTIVNNLVSNIVTGTSGDSCKEGMACSYACPPGYQKSQWPSTQGATGQSVGGLTCSGGKLRLSNPGLSKNLCIPGTGGVQAQNKAGGVVAICRTDYPGTESETVPLELQPGETEQLTCPDAATYYSWQSLSTSAQYYLNPIGTNAATGCQWGSPGGNIGNYAPINFGVGKKDGVIWLSIFQNAPTTNTQYQGTVEIQGDLSGTCKYSNGQYCGVTGCNAQGCTVSVLSGTATYVVSS